MGKPKLRFMVFRISRSKGLSKPLSKREIILLSKYEAQHTSDAHDPHLALNCENSLAGTTMECQSFSHDSGAPTFRVGCDTPAIYVTRL